MKRKGFLYEDIISLENLKLADKKARKGKKNNKDIIEFDIDREGNILKIWEELKSQTYTTSKYSHFSIYEPKKRDISKLPYRDRIVHHAIMNYLTFIFTRSFISQTYSCIKGRGIHKCLSDLSCLV